MSKSNSQKQRSKTIATNDSLRVAQIKKVPDETNNKAHNNKLFILDIHSEASEGTYEEWIALIKAHATANYGEIVQEINLEQPLPDPDAIAEPAGNASKAVLARYSIDYKARQDTIKDRKDLRSKLIGFLQTYCSTIINSEVEEVLPNYRTDPNVPTFIKAIRNAYKQASIFTDNFSQNALKIKYAEFLHPFIWTGSYNIFKHHQVYTDIIKEYDLVGLDKPTEEQQAIDFLYSLSPDFINMQVELRNNENRVRTMPTTSATLRSLNEAADLMPKTLSAAFKYARQYVGSSYVIRPPSTDGNVNVSNNNYTSTNNTKQKGKSRKRNKHKKSPAKSRSPSPQSNRDGSDSDGKQQQKKKHKQEEMYCDICDYTNHNTCDCYRLKPLIKKYKAAFLKSCKTSSKTSNINYTQHSDNSSANSDDDDDDDHGEGSDYTRMVNINVSNINVQYDKYHAVMDNGANIIILKDKKLVTNIRRAKRNKKVLTSRGVKHYKWEADSIFGTVLYDPTAPYNIISQSHIEILYEHTAIKSNKITVQHDVKIQDLGIILRSTSRVSLPAISSA